MELCRGCDGLGRTVGGKTCRTCSGSGVTGASAVAKVWLTELTNVDVFICIMLPLWGLIAGLLRLVTGNPTAGAMLGVSALSLVGWFVLGFARGLLMQL